MFSSVSRTIAIALALSTAAGCAVSADGSAPASNGDGVSGVERSAATKAQEVPASPESALADMAEALLESVLGEGMSALFPHEGIDYDRLSADFKAAAQQADLDQTLMEQSRAVDGKAVTLAEAEISFDAGGDPSELIQILDKDKDDIATMLSTLSDPQIEKAGLPAYVAGAQIKLSIWGFLMKINPSRADSYREPMAYDARLYFDHVAKVKLDLLAQGKQSRMDLFTSCAAYYNPTFGFTEGWSYIDKGTNAPHGLVYTFEDETSCNYTRNLLWYGAGSNKIISMSSDLQWIDTILNAWQVIGRPNTVSVTSATYGNACNVTPNNVTAMVGLACNGQNDCTYNVSRDVLGDQRVGCAKDFEVHYTCAGASTAIKTVVLPPEASGHSVQLTCP